MSLSQSKLDLLVLACALPKGRMFNLPPYSNCTPKEHIQNILEINCYCGYRKFNFMSNETQTFNFMSKYTTVKIIKKK